MPCLCLWNGICEVSWGRLAWVMDWVGIGVYIVGVDVLLVWFVCAIVDYGRGWSCSDINVVLSKRQEVTYLYVDYLKGIGGWFHTVLRITSLG